MMKSIQSRLFLLFIFLTAPFLGKSQTNGIPVDEETKLITYKEVVNSKGTKDELYVRAIEWVNTYYKNPIDVTRTRDRENGLIKGVARFKTTYIDKEGLKHDGPLIEYSLMIECKDGRYRFTFNQITSKEASRQPVEKWLNKNDHAYNPQYEDYLNQIDAYFKTTITSLKKGLEPKVVKDDSW